MRWPQKIKEYVLLQLSEAEASFATAQSNMRVRQHYLCCCGVQFTPPLWIGKGLWIRHGENLKFGVRCAFGEFTRIIAHEQITIGDEFTAASGLYIDSGSHDPVTMEPRGSAVTIGDRVWCGMNVTILPGITIGDDVVIGAGSVVCKDLPGGVIAAGNPARVLRKLHRTSSTKIWTWTELNKA